MDPSVVVATFFEPKETPGTLVGVSRECPSRVYVPAGGHGGLAPFPSSLACCCNRTAMLVLVLSCPLEYGDPRPTPH